MPVQVVVPVVGPLAVWADVDTFRAVRVGGCGLLGGVLCFRTFLLAPFLGLRLAHLVRTLPRVSFPMSRIDSVQKDVFAGMAGVLRRRRTEWRLLLHRGGPETVYILVHYLEMFCFGCFINSANIFYLFDFF